MTFLHKFLWTNEKSEPHIFGDSLRFGFGRAWKACELFQGLELGKGKHSNLLLPNISMNWSWTPRDASVILSFFILCNELSTRISSYLFSSLVCKASSLACTWIFFFVLSPSPKSHSSPQKGTWLEFWTDEFETKFKSGVVSSHSIRFLTTISKMMKSTRRNEYLTLKGAIFPCTDLFHFYFYLYAPLSTRKYWSRTVPIYFNRIIVVLRFPSEPKIFVPALLWNKTNGKNNCAFLDILSLSVTRGTDTLNRNP